MRIWVISGLVGLLVPAGLPLGTFDLRPPAGRVEFSVRDNRGGFTGETREVTATATVHERGGAYTAEVEARIDARTIVTGATLRDMQMRSPAFLHTARFPFITFRGTVSAQPVGPQFRGTLRGRLTVKDVTREIEMPLDITVDGGTYAVRGEVALAFTQFGLPVPRFLIFVAEDAITVRLAVRLIPRPAPP